MTHCCEAAPGHKARPKPLRNFTKVETVVPVIACFHLIKNLVDFTDVFCVNQFGEKVLIGKLKRIINFLEKLIENTKNGIVYGEWNDNGRLLNY